MAIQLMDNNEIAAIRRAAQELRYMKNWKGDPSAPSRDIVILEALADRMESALSASTLPDGYVEVPGEHGEAIRVPRAWWEAHIKEVASA